MGGSVSQYWVDRFDSPLGELTLVVSEKGVYSLGWGADPVGRQRIPSCLAKGPRPPLIQEAKRQLKEYFDGTRKHFPLPLDLRGTSFQLSAWKALLRIPYGKTISYQEQAKRVGSTKLARAVGGANRRNPVPIIVPCHRVIGKNGHLTGFGGAGGLDTKRFLLHLESAH